MRGTWTQRWRYQQRGQVRSSRSAVLSFMPSASYLLLSFELLSARKLIVAHCLIDEVSSSSFNSWSLSVQSRPLCLECHNGSIISHQTTVADNYHKCASVLSDVQWTKAAMSRHVCDSGQPCCLHYTLSCDLLYSTLKKVNCFHGQYSCEHRLRTEHLYLPEQSHIFST